MKRLTISVGLTALLLAGCGGGWGWDGEEEVYGTLVGLEEGTGAELIVHVSNASLEIPWWKSYDLRLTKNGDFLIGWFPRDGYYSVTVTKEPPGQSCQFQGESAKASGINFGGYRLDRLVILCTLIEG